MDFRILGPIEAIDGDRPLALGGTKQRALLGMLLLHAGEVVSSDRLIDELWPGERREEAIRALQVAVSRLRRALEPGRAAGASSRLLVTRPPGYELRAPSDRIDAKRFEELTDEGRRALAAGAAGEAREKLEAALGLWRGSPLADLAYESFCQAEIDRLEDLRVAALEDRIAADLELGRHAELVGELRTLVREQPLRERVRAQLMLALYRSGRQAEALEAFAQARRTLVEELGIEPGRGLRELHQAMLEQDPSLELVAAREPAAAGAQGSPGVGARGAFVGREPELAELLAGLEDAFAGRGRLFLLAGEPGIGKSRLAEEVGAHAATRGARVLVGRCWEAGGAPAYWPWAQALRAYVRESEPTELRAQLGAGAVDLARLVPELRERFPELPEPVALESEGSRFRLFDATADFFRSAAEARPILLFLDDLHAADEPSLLLLRFLARSLGSARVLVLGAHRDLDPLPAPPLTEMLAEVAREPVTRRMSLRGLSESEVADYVGATAAEFASPELVAGVHEETEGNPLFVGEIVRLLAVEGAGESAGELRLAIPDSVREVIARRLTHLSEECNRLLVLASVLGREFDLDPIARMAEVSEDELLDTLDEAIEARAVSDVPAAPGRLRFAHVLIRDTLYEGLTAPRRIRLHRLAAEALAALPDERESRLAELARHSIAGHDLDNGVSYAHRAGDRALAMLAFEESARLYAMALEAFDLAGREEDVLRCELLLRLGEAEARGGNTPAARSAFVDAAGIARRLGLARELARAAAGYGGRIVWGRAGHDERLVPLLEEALAALPEEEVELRARLLARLAGALRDEPTRDRRAALSREAVELARRTDNGAALAYALDGRAAVIVAPDTVAECFALASELIEVAERVSDTERMVQGYCDRCIAQLQSGELSAAEADLEAAMHVARDLRQPAYLWQVRGAQAMIALAQGTLPDAERLVSEAFAYGEHVQPAAATPVYWMQRYTLADFRGSSLAQIERALRELVAEHPARVVFRCALAHVHARLARTMEARRALDDLSDARCAALPFDQEWLFGLSFLAETAALLETRDYAAMLYGLLLPWEALNVVDQGEGIRGPVSRYLGILALTNGDWDNASRHFEHALAMNARMGTRPWLAYAQDDYARMLLARNESGDRERAQGLRGLATASYRELGMATPKATPGAGSPSRTAAR